MRKGQGLLATLVMGLVVVLGVMEFGAARLVLPVVSAAEPEAEAPVAPKKGKKKNYRRSRLTFDETEGKADRRHLLLTTGEDRSVDLDFEPRGAGPDGIAIGNPQIVSTTLVRIGEKQQIVFKPLKSGETTVTIRDKDGLMQLVFEVRVTGSNLLRIASELRRLLRDVEGIEIQVIGAKVVIEGEILVPADYGRVITVLRDSSYDKQVLNLATLSSYALLLLAKKIQDDISTFAQNVKTRVVNGFIFLEGNVDNPDSAKRALDVAYLYLPDMKPNSPMENDPNGVQRLPPRSLIKSLIVINPPPAKKQDKLVRVTVHFVELDKSYNRMLGFKWEPGFTADPHIDFGTTQAGGVGTNSFSLTGTIGSLIPRLNTLQTAGYGRILKTGTVVVRNGQPAKLNEQTDISFPISQPNGQTASSKASVGLVMAVTPQIIGQSEDILLDINMKQVNLVSVEKNGPITSNHDVETKLFVKSKESAAIAGVNSSDVGTDFNKNDPSSGTFDSGQAGVQSQPLFSLKNSKAYRKKKSQFVIFVTPEIIENAADGTEDLKKNFRVKVR